MKTVAVVLAGGSGSRMKNDIKKQYMIIGGRPVLWYSLRVFQDASFIDEIVLVCGEGETGFCRRRFVDEYGFSKITTVTEGGKERYDSVYNGLKAAEGCDYVMIHDGARPFIDEDMLERIMDTLMRYPACIVGMPVKDTIKISDPDGFVKQTLPREKLWMVQTPQSFSYSLIREAYDRLSDRVPTKVPVTDDAMVAEYFLHTPVKLIEGSYDNIKITTPEDLVSAEAIIQCRKAH